MYQHLANTPSDLFFQQLRDMVIYSKCMSGMKYSILEDDQDPMEDKEEIIVIRFIQLMSEGHFRSNQDVMREQPFNIVSYNICAELVIYLIKSYPVQTQLSLAMR